MSEDIIKEGKSGKSCFITTPIGNNNSEIRRAAEGAIDSAIIPALIENGYDRNKVYVAHRISDLGSINNQIIKHTIECDLVIANLTTLNPNVMYELAVRDAAMKPAILICDEETVLPFDVKEQRTLFYKNDMYGVIELKNSLHEFLKDTTQKVDNPITRGIQRMKLLDTDKIDSVETMPYLLKKIEELDRKVSGVASKKSTVHRNEYQYNLHIETDNLKYTIQDINDIMLEQFLSVYYLSPQIRTVKINKEFICYIRMEILEESLSDILQGLQLPKDIKILRVKSITSV